MINVCASNAGAFGVLRGDLKLQSIAVAGNSLIQDVAALRPYLCSPLAQSCPEVLKAASTNTQSYGLPISDPQPNDQDVDEDEDDANIQRNIKTIENLCHVVECNNPVLKGNTSRWPSDEIDLAQGADVIIEAPGLEFPAHRVILAARCPVLEEVLSGTKAIQDGETGLSLKLVRPQHWLRVPCRLSTAGCHPLSLLFLISYLYTDELPAVWDPRVTPTLEPKFRSLKTCSKQIKVELQALVRVLGLPSLARTVNSPSTISPSPSLAHDMRTLLRRTLDYHSEPHIMSLHSPLFPDVHLQLAEGDIPCHSMILRARSAFFADFFDDPDWTMKRWETDGTIKIDMKHMKERVLRFILDYIYGDDEVFAHNG